MAEEKIKKGKPSIEFRFWINCQNHTMREDEKIWFMRKIEDLFKEEGFDLKDIYADG